jgi:hypothetical protein
MTAIKFRRLTRVPALLIVATVATLTVMGIVESGAVLGGSILFAVVVVAFQLGL